MPTACYVSEGEEGVPHRFDCLRIAGRRAARVPAEVGQHLFLWRVEAEQRVAALEVSLFRLICELAVFESAAPLAAPRPRDVDPISDVDALGPLLVDGALPEDESERHDKAGARLVDGGQLVAEPVLDVIRVNPVIHDLKCGIRASRCWSAVR